MQLSYLVKRDLSGWIQCVGGGTMAGYFGLEAPHEMNSRGQEGACFQTGVDSTGVSRKRVLIFTF